MQTDCDYCHKPFLQVFGLEAITLEWVRTPQGTMHVACEKKLVSHIGGIMSETDTCSFCTRKFALHNPDDTSIESRFLTVIPEDMRVMVTSCYKLHKQLERFAAHA